MNSVSLLQTIGYEKECCWSGFIMRHVICWCLTSPTENQQPRHKMWTFAALLLMAAGFSQGYICPDGSRCLNSQTCCAAQTFGKFTCCPYPNAVCCADKVHCCPTGKICNAATVQCEGSGQDSFPMLEKVKPQEPGSSQSLKMVHLLERDHKQDLEMTLKREEKVQPSKAGVVWCDSTASCNDGYSCCFTQSGQWWCCAYSPSKCCVDGVHCCPYGYDCDVTSTTCKKQGLRYPFAPRLALQASVPANYISENEKQMYGDEM